MIHVSENQGLVFRLSNLLTVANVSACDGNTPSGYAELLHGQASYKLHEEAKTFADSEATCASEGSHLAFGKTKEELGVMSFFMGKR